MEKGKRWVAFKAEGREALESSILIKMWSYGLRLIFPVMKTSIDFVPARWIKP